MVPDTVVTLKIEIEVNVRSPGGSRAKMLWKVRDAKERGDAYYDLTSAKKIESRNEVRQELCSKHLQSTALTLSEAFRVEEREDAGSRTAGSRH